MEPQPLPRTIDGLLYRVGRPDEQQTIWRLLLEEFFAKTPLNQHLGSTTSEDVAEQFALPPGLLEQGVTLVVEEPATRELVGARVSCLVTRAGAKRHPLVADPELGAKWPKDSAVYRVLDAVAAPVDIFAHYGVDRVVDFKYLVVKQTMRSRNIAKNLIDCSLQVARDKGVPVVNVIAAHRHAERIFQSMGFDRLNSLVLADYTDPVSGERPFADIDPAVLQEIVLFAKRTGA